MGGFAVEVTELAARPPTCPLASQRQRLSDQRRGLLGLTSDQMYTGEPDQVERAVALPAPVTQYERLADVAHRSRSLRRVVTREVAIASANHPS